MTTKQASKKKVEVEAVETPVKASEVVTPEAPKEVVTFVEYLKHHKVDPLLVASFSYEASRIAGGTDPRTEDAWRDALVAQSKRVYK